MDDKHLSRKNKQPRKYIIGLLGDELHFELPVKVLQQVKALAAENNIEIYYFVGQPLESQKGFFYQSNILYKFISREILDGLIIMSNVLSAYVNLEEFTEKCRQYHSLPRISLGLDMEDMPSVLADNEAGICTAVSHLIEVHHYTRIGFLNGPLTHPEARMRFQAFTRTMHGHALQVNPTLVFQGNFQASSAIQAIAELIEKRERLPGRDIEALICANDYMATGAQLELQARGYRIPEDIAIVGFDDINYVKCLTPSLSTISNPIRKMAAKAFELLLDLFAGKQVPKTVSIPTEFIPRNSCGCTDCQLPNINSLASFNSESMIQASHNRFLQGLNKKVSLTSGPNSLIWQDAFTFLKTCCQWEEKNRENSQDGDLIRAAYSILGITADRTLSNAAYEVKVQSLGINMISTLDLPELLEILINELPSLGIHRCYLNLYENPAEYNCSHNLPLWSSMVLAFHEQNGQIVKEKLPPGGLRFKTLEFIPREISTKYGLMSWIVLALYFREEQIGFLLLDSDAPNESFYYFFRLQISSSLKGVLLLKGYQEHSRKLADAYAQIRKFNKQLEDENLHIKMEMDAARSIQTAMMPKNVRNIHPDFEIASIMIPAMEMGGDYFDITIDEQQNLWIGIGDVSGHGLKAGMIMMIAQIAQTTITTNYNVTPRDVIIMMNRVMFQSVTNRMEQNQYMTCSILKYLKHGCFQYSGMHLNFLIYRQKDKTCDEITLTGIWLNIVEDIEEFTGNSTFMLDTGDVLVLYTDGITEVADKNRQLLDIQGLKRIIIRHGDKNIDDMLDATREDVQSFSAGIDKDDMSLVLIRRIR